MADPTENVVSQRAEMVIRTREREVFKSRRRIDFRHASAMAERIRCPCDKWFNAKLLLEIFAADGELAEEINRIRHVLIWLDPTAANGAPTSCRHELFDSRKKAWIGLLDMIVDGGFAAVEREFGEAIHEFDDGAAGLDAFVEAFMLVPEPDGIEMRVRQDVEDFFHGGNGVGYGDGIFEDKLKLYSFTCENAKSGRDFHGRLLTVGGIALLLKGNIHGGLL